MYRLPGFDYKSPFFYMVTLKRRKGLAALSEIGPEGVVANRLTRAFEAVIRGFPAKSGKTHAPGFAESEGIAGCEGIAVGEGFAGGASAQPRGLSRETPPPPLFERDWHDWIVKKEGQLAAFRRYICENAARAWERRVHAQYFGRVSEVAFLGRRWFAYGNRALLDLPVLLSFKGHRATAEGSREWNALLTAARRIGPGGAGVSTFMSPLEKACGNAIARAGGGLIVLSPEGFGPRWHPSREKERFCAQGRMLFLSLYEATPRQPTRAELYHRCHEMIDLARTGLS